MQRAFHRACAYIKNLNIVETLFFACFSLCIRRASWAKNTFYSSCYGIEESFSYAHTHIENPYAEKQYFLTWSVGKLALLCPLPVLIFLCDLGTAFFLGDKWYLFFSSFMHSDATALLSLSAGLVYYFSSTIKKRYPWVRRFFYAILSALLFESTSSSCTPGINMYWYINIQMLEQYKKMHEHLFLCTHIFLWSLSWKAFSIPTQIFICSIFKECGLRGHLAIWRMLANNRKSMPEESKRDACIFYLCESLFSLCILLIGFIWWMIHCGVGNMNFLCWSTIILIFSTGTAVLLSEIQHRSREKLKKE